MTAKICFYCFLLGVKGVKAFNSLDTNTKIFVMARKVSTDCTNEDDRNLQQEIVPDKGWGWVIVFASFFIHFISKHHYHNENAIG